MAKPEDFERVGNLLGDFYSGAASPSPEDGEAAGGPRRPSACRQTTPSHVARSLAAVWPEVAGPEVAANAVPVQLKAGRLVVTTSSSGWAQTLLYAAEDLAARLNERLGADTVKQIVFRHAGWEERAPGATADRQADEAMGPGGLSAEQAKALANLEDLKLPGPIRETIARAMRSSFDREGKDTVR
jgi:hypothetical protein